ncbi:hypothetical protein Cha6605_4454 [Chamaesiphon minutus PCC 6605]|uniref:Uncharacterized protein n=2 Tax=Chamaesiphon TaxID=217161 RepID=K9UKP6_CHAP6|nr:hypothetical protein Cha6605_4454 [Chamaesiphon minutus PCC 6605]
MKGLFGRFGKKTTEQSAVSNENSRKNDFLRDGKAERRSKLEVEDRQNDALSDWDRATPSDRDFPISSSFDDDEETNWDDAETLADENNQIVYAQPIAPETIPTIPKTTLDIDDWDDALPAPTVRDRNTLEARRSKNSIPLPTNEDIWDDIPLDTSIPLASPPTFSPITAESRAQNLRDSSTSQSVNRVVGKWAGLMEQFRRILPAQIQKFADAIAIAIIVAFLTIGIWFVDGFFVPKIKPSVASPTPAPAPSIAQPTPTDPDLVSTPQISPEQVFIEEIEAQLSEITSQYPADLVRSLSVDLARDRLIVQLNLAWYTIDEELQTSLTDRMWQQAQANHFTKLEVQDSQGVSIARSPVVGKHPIIMRRRES